MNKLLISDLVILEQQCNSRCDYCITSDSKLKTEHREDRTKDGKIRFTINDVCGEYAEGTILKQDLDTILDKLRCYFNAPCLIMSGGEIFLNRNIIDFIECAAEKFPLVQILTNGTVLNENMIERISGMGNVHISLSLDGHTLELNHHRTKSQKILDIILANLKLLNIYKIPTEIFCVISDANCSKIYEFAEYLNEFDNIKLFPFPVRGTPGNLYFPKYNDINGIDRLIDDYEKYKNVLLPKAYLIELRKFLITQKRERRCYVPCITMQTFNDGVVTPCPFSWSQAIFNLLEIDKQTAMERSTENSFYRMANRERVFMPFCKKCFNHLDLVNLFIDDIISLKELKSVPLFAEPSVTRRLKEIKMEIRGKCNE